MNNKQVPEEIITDAFQISEDLKNGNIHNNRQFVQLSHVKELVASLPAEPSTPETKDKPATGLGGGAEGIVNATVTADKDLPENTKEALVEMIGKASEMVSMKELIKKHLGWHPTDSYMPSAKHFVETGVVSGNLYLAIEKIAKEYATLLQPTGTVLLSDIQERIKELNELDNDYCRVRWDNNADNLRKALAREESNKVTFARQELERLAELAKKPIQFLPEREGVWDAAITLANNICVQISDEYNNDDRTFEADAATNCAKKIRTALGQSQTFLQSTGEGINE